VKINVSLPGPMEAEVTIDDKRNVVDLTPFFYSGVTAVPAMRINVENGKGVKRQFAIMLNSKTGGVTVQSLDRKVAAAFDTLTPEEFKAKQAKVKTKKPKAKATEPPAPDAKVPH